MSDTNVTAPAPSVITPMVETVLRYVLNTGFTSLATYNIGTAAQIPTETNMALAAISSVATLSVWAWGIYRSRTAGKMADIAQVKGTTVVTTEALAKSVPASNVVSNNVNQVVGK